MELSMSADCDMAISWRDSFHSRRLSNMTKTPPQRVLLGSFNVMLLFFSFCMVCCYNLMNDPSHTLPFHWLSWHPLFSVFIHLQKILKMCFCLSLWSIVCRLIEEIKYVIHFRTNTIIRSLTCWGIIRISWVT